MTPTVTDRWFVTDSRSNALVTWALLAVVLGAASVALLRGDYVGAALALTAVAVVAVPAVRFRTWTRTVPWPMVLLAAVPLLVRGVQPTFLSTVLVGLSVATVAMLVVEALQMTTSVRMTPRFGLLLVVAGTLGFAGFWAVGAALSSRYLGTPFVETNEALMNVFVAASVAGLLAGAAFSWYFGRYAVGADRSVPPKGGETA